MASSLERKLQGHARPPRKDADGIWRCRWCEGPCSGRKRSFCSDLCVHEWRLRSDPGYLRDQVFKRDRGICANCGADTEALQVRLKAMRHFDLARYRRTIEACKIPNSRVFGGSLWDADHILPVAEGGGLAGLEEIQTLCIPCHLDKTTEQAHRRRKASK